MTNTGKEEVLTTFQSQLNEKVVETFTLRLQSDTTPPDVLSMFVESMGEMEADDPLC